MQSKLFRRVLFTGALVTTVFGVLVFATSSQGGADAAVGPPQMPAPSWELKDANGKLVKLSDFKGKVVILDFWATWCGPCRMEIPGFVDLQKKYGGQGLTVIGVSLDEGGPQAVKPFIKKLGVNYPVVLGNTEITRNYGGIEAIPTTFIINRQGMIVGKHLGYEEKTQFEAEIKQLLKE